MSAVRAPARDAQAEPGPASRTGPRVCVVNANLPPDYGGAELAALEYARRVRAGGGEAVLIGKTPGRRPEAGPRRDWVHPAVVPEDGRPRGVARLAPGSFRALLRLGRPLWRRMWSLRDRFDVVHVFNSAPPFNLLAAPFGRMLGKPVVLEMSLRGSDDALTIREKGGSGDGGSRLGLPSFRFLLFRMADAHVAKSPALADAYRRSGLSEEGLWEIPYGVDVERFRPASERERAAARRALGLPEEGVQALFVGGICARKGVHWLVEAYRRIRRDHPGLHLVLAGPTEKYDRGFVGRLRRALSDEELAGRVTFVDRMVDNVHEYMRAADIHVLPSTREGLPITVLEAMASGLAVLASDIPEISGSQIESGETGLLVPVGDVDALAAGLSSLAGDPDLRSRLARAARARAERVFSTEVVDRRYRELYGSIGADRPRPGTST